MTAPCGRLLALIVLAGLVAFAAPAEASAAAKQARCAAKRSHTVAKNRLVRVYSVSRNGNRRLTGCLRKTGRKLARGQGVRRRLRRERRLPRRAAGGALRRGRVRRHRRLLQGRLPAGLRADPDLGRHQRHPHAARPDHAHARAGRARCGSRPRAWRRGSPRSRAALELHGYDGAGETMLDSGAIDPASRRARRAPAHLGERGRSPQRRR